MTSRGFLPALMMTCKGWMHRLSARRGVSAGRRVTAPNRMYSRSRVRTASAFSVTDGVLA